MSGEIEELATIDKTGFPGTLLRIVLSIASPGMAVGAIFMFIKTYNESVIPIQLLTDAERHSITVALYAAPEDTTIHWQVVTGSSLIVLLPPGLMFDLFQRSIIHGFTCAVVKN